MLPQVELFESEQAKWTEVEQSLYNQISQLNEDHQSLLAKKHTKSPSVESQAVEIPEGGLNSSKSLILSPTPSHLATASPTFQIPETTLEELQHLHMRVADLSSEQAALQAEVLRLENELEEVQRVNSDLQEQNENYEVLLSERMLAGLNAFTDSGNGSSLGTSGMQEGSTTGSRPPSSLDRLEEEEDGLATDDEDGPEVFESSGDGNLSTGAVAANMTPNRLNKTAKKRQSMMGLGGGLDLEAELDRARREEEEERQKAEEKAKRKKDRDVAARRRANQSTATIGDGEPLPADVETLRKEVKLLRQENKGVSLTLKYNVVDGLYADRSQLFTALYVCQQDIGEDHRNRRFRKGFVGREGPETSIYPNYCCIPTATPYTSKDRHPPRQHSLDQANTFTNTLNGSNSDK